MVGTLAAAKPGFGPQGQVTRLMSPMRMGWMAPASTGVAMRH